MQVVGLVHDLGKLLNLIGSEGQWDVVGDTFVVGAAFSDKNIYPETFAANPDATHPVYSTPNGIYTPGCGLDNVLISWGHDEYMYTIAKEQSTLPPEALAMIRYHSFYPCVALSLLPHSRTAARILTPSSRHPQMAPRGRLCPLYGRGRPQIPRSGPGVQPVRPILKGRRARRHQCRPTLLPGPHCQILPRHRRMVARCTTLFAHLST